LNAVEVTLENKKGLKQGSNLLVPLGSGNTSVALMTFENPDDMNHIISTLKFTEIAKIDDIQHWPIYEDKQSGFTFPYPPVFKTEPYQSSSGDKGVRVIYDNPAAPGIPPLVPAKIVLEATVVKTPLKADAYAQELLKSSEVSAPGIVSESIGSRDAFKAFIPASKSNPLQTVGYYFTNLNNSVLEIKAYYPNTESLKLNGTNILDSIVYKFKFPSN